MKLLLAFFSALLLISCNDAQGEKMDLVGIPIFLAGVAIFGLILGIKLSLSGTSEYDKVQNKYVKTRDRFPFFAKENYGAVIFISFLIAAIGVYFYMRAGN